MKEARFNFAVDISVHEDFKIVAFLRKSSITKLLTDYIKEVIEEEKDMIDRIKKKQNKLKRKTK